MKPILYFDDISPPVRSVLMLIDELKIDVEYKLIDLFKRENRSEEFVKISPVKTLPALKHNDIVITDSHVILIYLAEEFGEDSGLYPQDRMARIRVMDMLFYNGTNLFRKDSDVMTGIITKSIQDINSHLIKILDCYETLESFLANSSFLCGNSMTIADISIVATLSTLNLVQSVDKQKFPALSAWFDKMRTYPFYVNPNIPGLQKLRAILQDRSNFDIELAE